MQRRVSKVGNGETAHGRCENGAMKSNHGISSSKNVLFEPMMDGPARRPIEQLLEVFENRCNASRMQRHEYQTRPRLHKICCRILWFSDVWTGGRHLIGPWKSFLAFPSTRVTVSLELAQRWGSMSRIAGELSYHTCNTRVYVYTYYF